MLFHRPEGRNAEGLRHLLTQLLLFAGEGFERGFEIARHHHLHGVAVKTDELAQEIDGKEILPFLVLLLEDDLRQHRTGDVVAALGIINDEIFAALHHCRQVFQRYIGAGAGIVEPPVGVFLDGDGAFGFCHDTA
jgi:hypothetical protein